MVFTGAPASSSWPPGSSVTWQRPCLSATVRPCSCKGCQPKRVIAVRNASMPCSPSNGKGRSVARSNTNFSCSVPRRHCCGGLQEFSKYSTSWRWLVIGTPPDCEGADIFSPERSLFGHHIAGSHAARFIVLLVCYVKGLAQIAIVPCASTRRQPAPDEPRLYMQHTTYLHSRLDSYMRLTRLNKPIGIFLVAWPMLWALWLAAEGLPDLWILAVFVLGSILMRSAGCVVNDFADRNIDGHVKRTKTRPLATGEVS